MTIAVFVATGKGKYTIWRDTDKDVPFLGELQAHYEKDESGVIVVTQLSCLKSFLTPPSDAAIHCDVLLISDKKGVHLITVVNEPPSSNTEEFLKNVAGTLDRNLKGVSQQDSVEQSILFHHIVPIGCAPISDIIRSDVLPVPEEWGIPHQFEGILESLVVMLNVLSPPWSYFSQRTGVEILYLSTQAQCELIWGEMGKHKTLFVHGLAGTGKTVMAEELMRRLSLKDGAETVLYLCSTDPLRNEVR